MIDIILAIIYYVTVLTTEIIVLYNEDATQKRLAAAARDPRGKKDPKGRTSQRAVLTGDPDGGRLVASPMSDFNAGRIEQQTNPIFVNAGGVPRDDLGGVGGGALSVDVVLGQRQPPSQDLWGLFQTEFVSMAAQLAASQEQLAESKRAAALRSDDGEVADDASRAALRKGKTGFAPRTVDPARNSAAAAILRASKRVGPRADY